MTTDNPYEPPIYDRLTAEPLNAYGYFGQYLALGEGREVKELAKKVKPTASYLYRLAAKWQWHERAAAYDRAEAGKVAAEVRAARVRLSRQQLAVSAGMLSWSARFLAAMTEEKMLAMSASEVARWSKTAVDLGRAALGEPDARIAVGTSGTDGSFRPLAGMGDADRRAELGECLAELGARIAAGELVEDEDALLALLAGPVKS